MGTEETALVVGAGPTGLLLAGELHRRGIRCRLIDAHPAPLSWDRATVVHPRSLEVFEALGIVEPLLAAGVKQRFARLHSEGRVLGEIELASCGSRYGFNLGVSEERTEAVLTEYLERQGGAVERGCRLRALTDRGPDVLCRIEREGVSEDLSVGWVVGCDGLHSTTREQSGIELIGHDIAEPWAVFDATLAGWPDSYEAIYAYLDVVPVILTALPERRWRVYLRPGSEESDLVAEASSTIGRYAPGVAIDDVASATRFHCHTKVASRFRSGRVLLAGDAAHLCSPAEGHGMNAGLQDAFNLAWKLALVCHGRSRPELLDSYQDERLPVARAITASGDSFEHAQTLREPGERRARDEAMRALFADPTSSHHEAIAEAELNIDYSGSPIVLGDRSEALGPGQRLPDTIPVRLGGGETRGLHELTHRTGHTALLVGGAGARADEIARVGDELRGASGAGCLVEATIALAGRTRAGRDWARLEEADAARLGVEATTLLVIRPDGHVGLRADRDHARALAAYDALIAAGRV